MITQFYIMTDIEERFRYDKRIQYLFLCCGEDNRAYETLRRLHEMGIVVDNVVVFDFEERKRGLSKDQEDSYYSYKKYPFKFLEIPASLHSPSDAVKRLKEYHVKPVENDFVALDISCFTKPTFFLILKVLQTEYLVKYLTVFYTEPKSYYFSKGLYNSFRSSSGPLRVMEVPGFTGAPTRRQKRLLVILLGFDGDLAREISEDVAPETTIIINGFPSYEAKFKDISLICNEKLTSNPRNELKYSRANNPFEIFNVLDSLKRKYGTDAFINVAPLGTKPMALGACLFALHNPDVRIVYPMPQTYEKKTSDNCHCSWAYDIPLVFEDHFVAGSAT